ncbi:peptide/nickel transport system permease protein [Cytobacillus firmus]|uniref:Peptide/nickel transport system permease protein n=2 Tax=Cytobacillus TaxID=2675230 RepID=A0A366JGH2_CYTFI|nr:MULTISPECIES: ABC transporter permease [Cytobacillus]RBP86095.1 peptide/nickel transport system permease protein [Cytobacillus firmus]TDX35451.1 peptide/nickel transport system permease protein [Cytobacillus oceanisediminis]
MEVSTQSTIQADVKTQVKNKKSTLLSRLRENRVTYLSLWFLVLIHIVVFLGPFLWTVNPEDLQQAGALAGWSLQHPFGTDDLGRDVFARMLTGGRVTLVVGLGAMLCSLLIGTVIGACAGFMGKVVEAVLMRLTEAMMAIPTFFFVLVALTVIGTSPLMVVLVIAFSSWMEIARVVYGETLKWKQYEFVEAANASGATPFRILTRYIIPQIIPSIIVAGTLTIAGAILTESAISYLGLGIQPPTATWGNMLQNSQQYIWTAPILGVLPGIAITVVVLAYNFLGDGLRDALDPKFVKK